MAARGAPEAPGTPDTPGASAPKAPDTPIPAIFDTNVFVAAGFNRGSASARLVEAARAGHVLLIWHETTRAENARVLEKIPRLSWAAVADLFGPEGLHTAPLDLAAVGFVEDPEDRKFAALSRQAGVPLVSADAHLLAHADKLDVCKPSDFRARYPAPDAAPTSARPA